MKTKKRLTKKERAIFYVARVLGLAFVATAVMTLWTNDIVIILTMMVMVCLWMCDAKWTFYKEEIIRG